MFCCKEDSQITEWAVVMDVEVGAGVTGAGQSHLLLYAGAVLYHCVAGWSVSTMRTPVSSD